LLALLCEKYGYSRERFLAEEPCYVNALYAAACESAGLRGKWTFLDMETADEWEQVKKHGRKGSIIYLGKFEKIERGKGSGSLK